MRKKGEGAKLLLCSSRIQRNRKVQSSCKIVCSLAIVRNISIENAKSSEGCNFHLFNL